MKKILQVGIYDKHNPYRNGVDSVVDSHRLSLEKYINDNYLIHNSVPKYDIYELSNAALPSREWNNVRKIDPRAKRILINDRRLEEIVLDSTHSSYIMDEGTLAEKFDYSLFLDDFDFDIIHLHTIPDSDFYSVIRQKRANGNFKLIYMPHSISIYDGIMNQLSYEMDSDLDLKEEFSNLLNLVKPIDLVKDVIRKESKIKMSSKLRTKIMQSSELYYNQNWIKAQSDLMNLADAITLPSYFMKNLVHLFYGDKYDSKQVVIENKSDFADYVDDPQIEYGVKKLENNLNFNRKTDVAIGYVGRLALDKGLDGLLDALINIYDNLKNTYLKIGHYSNKEAVERIPLRFYMIGSFDRQSYNILQPKIDYLSKNYPDKILCFNESNENIYYATCIPDRRKSLYAWMHFFDLAVVPSKHESFGLTALESMLAGTPLLASNVDSLADTFSKYALNTFNPYSTDSISHALSSTVMSLLSDKNLRNSGYESNLKKYVEDVKMDLKPRFSYNTLARELDNLYDLY